MSSWIDFSRIWIDLPRISWAVGSPALGALVIAALITLVGGLAYVIGWNSGFVAGIEGAP